MEEIAAQQMMHEQSLSRMKEVEAECERQRESTQALEGELQRVREEWRADREVLQRTQEEWRVEKERLQVRATSA
jgi:hypothetical protein